MYFTDNVIKVITKAHRRMLLGAVFILLLIGSAYAFLGDITAYEGKLVIWSLFVIIGYFSWRRHQLKRLKDDLVSYYQAISISQEEVIDLESKLQTNQIEWRNRHSIKLENFLICGSQDSIRESIVYLPLVEAVFVERSKSLHNGAINTLKFTYDDNSKLQSVTFAFRTKTGQEKESWNKLVEMISLKNPKAVWY